ncbi:hypothetical protein V8E53_014684 [Lactarius tabidus]
MVTTVGQHRSVAMPALPVTKPTAPPRELPKSTPVQQPTTCLAPQSSLPLEGVSTRMTSIPSLPEAQYKLKIRTAPTPAPAVPTAPLASPPATPLAAAPPTHVDDMTCVPAPTLRERASCISITNDPTTGRSRLPTIVAELETSRRAVQASVLSPTNLEQSAIDTPPSRSSSSTPIVRQDRASVVLPGTSTQKRTDPKSIPASRNFIGTTTAIAPAPTLRATNATAPVGNITVLPTPVAPNGSPTAPPKPAPQMTARLPAYPVTPSKQQQQTEPVTSSLSNSDHVTITRRSETGKPSYHGSRTEASGMVSGAETPQGKPRTHYSATALRPRQQRIISRIKTKDLINQHKLPPVTPSIAPSVEGPALWKSPLSELVTSQPTPTTPDLNRIDGGIERQRISSINISRHL